MDSNKWTEYQYEQPSGLTGRKRLKKEYQDEYDVVWTDGLNKEYVYVGSWYRVDMDDEIYGIFWKRQLGMGLLSLALFAVPALLDCQGAFHLYFMFPYIAAIVFALLTFIEIITCPKHAGRMEHMFYDENYGKREKYATITPPLSALAALTALIAIFVDGVAADLLQYVSVLALAADAVLQYYLLKMMRDLPIKREINERVKALMEKQE